MSAITFICPECGGKNEYKSDHPHSVPFVPQLDDGTSSKMTLSLVDAVVLDKRVTVCRHCFKTLMFDASLPACCDVVVKPFQITLRVTGGNDAAE